MTADVTVVFPGGHLRGGVERVAYEALRFLGPRYATRFVGHELQDATTLPVDFVPIKPRYGPDALRPLHFRRAAAARTGTGDTRRLLSFGANCPPGNCYWVQSVHRAWLTTGSSVRVRGLSVPSTLRRLLLRHQVLLHMEKQYFTQGHPDAIICTSQREADDLQQFYGVEPTLLHVIPNGYNADRFNPAYRQQWRDEMRPQMGLLDDDVSLLFVVNELHRKGFATLLDAVALTKDERLRVDIVGKAAPDDYQGQIERLGLRDRVRWHGPSSEVEKYMAAADLLVLPTQYEPFGLVIVEALGISLPVITTRLAGAAEAVAEGEVGLLQSDPVDAEELADLLRQAADDATRRRWSRAAAAAAAPYEWSKIMAQAEPLIMGTGR